MTGVNENFNDNKKDTSRVHFNESSTMKRGRYDSNYNGGMFNETDEDKLLVVIRGLIDSKELKLLKKLVKYNDTVSEMNAREMNKRFKIDGHVFRTRYGKLILIPYKYNYKSVKDQAEIKLNEFVNELSFM
ncbi:hypothetical protein M9Y10_041837 [Tritrichomonas musculus]|uniref:Uncharacterized protein n=1 Tax=Tritrichomonas musculus TaxID=1915356 RepID=A0ABR2K5N7_9EUKA